MGFRAIWALGTRVRGRQRRQYSEVSINCRVDLFVLDDPSRTTYNTLSALFETLCIAKLSRDLIEPFLKASPALRERSPLSRRSCEISSGSGRFSESRGPVLGC